MKKASLVHLASPGAGIAVRVTPRAARNAITLRRGATSRDKIFRLD